MVKTLPRRDEVPQEQTWDIQSVYPSDAAWEAAAREAAAALPELGRFRGRLGESAATLLEALQVRDRWRVVTGRIRWYAAMQIRADQGDQLGAAHYQQASSLRARVTETLAYFEPELLALGPDRLQTLVAELPELEVYRHYFDTLHRRRAHVRSVEVEEVIAAAGDLAASPYLTYSALTNVELPFGVVPSADGGEVAIAQGNVWGLILERDRAVRRAAWEEYADAHLRMRNTLANTIAGVVNRDVFFARVRNYPSALDAALHDSKLPRAVFDNLIATFRRHLPLWHRYWEIRRRALGLDDLQVYDTYVPLVHSERTISYARACEIICSAMEPLGEEYTVALRHGLYQERWVDWCANQGKMSGAESGGSYGTHPFLLLSYGDDLLSVSTLAHELGHSLHSYFTWQTQPPIYESYADFIGETASNFNQALVRAYLLRTDDDPAFQLEVLSEAIANFRRYLFLMPTLARFEVDCHAWVERGEGLTADWMSARMVELFREGYGPAVALDEPRVGITWAQFPHLFLNFYVYQYALGIAAANALADDVLREGAPAAGRYLRFLKAGDSLYPLDALRLAGVDLTSPAPVERAFEVLAGLIDRLDQLVGPGPLW